MPANDLHDLSNDELERRLADTRKELFNLRFQSATGQLENTARLRIQTIDGLCAWLTRQMPVLARFGAQPESVENEEAQGFYREAARATLGLLESRDANDAEAAVDVARLLAAREHGAVEAN